MDSDRWRRLKHLLDHVLELDEAERLVWLQNTCREDPSMLEEVMAFLDTPEAQTSALVPRPEFNELSVYDEDLTGQRFGVWVVERKLADGGMGAVWQVARADGAFQMKGALKLINHLLLCEPIHHKRFRRERQILANLQHPGIATLLDGGATEDGRPYLVMQCFEGEHIDQWCDRHALTIHERLHMFRNVCEAVAYAHGRGVIHRDIKCSNIMVTENGQSKLLDFGVASIESGEENSLITMPTGRPPITPEYASPEQLMGVKVEKTSDIYALGLVLFRLITGIRPTRLRSNRKILSSSLMERVKCDDSHPNLFENLNVIMGKMLECSPQDRYADMSLLIEDLDRCLIGLAPCPDDWSPKDKPYEALIWYHPNDRVWVQQLAWRLEHDHRLLIWLDVRDPDPCEPIPAAYAEALVHAKTCIVVLGPTQVSPWKDSVVREVFEARLRHTKTRIIPVLLPDASEPRNESELPRFLRWLNWYQLENPDMGARLLAHSIRHQQNVNSSAIALSEMVSEAELGQSTHDIQYLASQLQQNKFLAILGPEGCGKSKLLQEGLVPALVKDNPLISFNPKQQPIEALAVALSQFAQSGQPVDVDLLNRRLQANEEALYFVIRELVGREKRLLMVIEHFEDIFRLADESMVKRFLAALFYAMEHGRIAIILTIHNRNLDQCHNYPDLNAWLVSHGHQLIAPADLPN